MHCFYLSKDPLKNQAMVIHCTSILVFLRNILSLGYMCCKNQYCIQGKFRPRFIFALFRSEGEFKTGPIEFYIKEYVKKKFESGQIQDWANQYYISLGRK